MTYNKKYNEQNYKYRSEKFKRVGIDVERTYYEEILKPAADSLSMPVGTFIKQAIEEKINNMKK